VAEAENRIIIPFGAMFMTNFLQCIKMAQDEAQNNCFDIILGI
jgi:hypothetical protein